jgi:hypothetical protein
MGFESIGEFRHCMESLGLNGNDERTHTVAATFCNDRERGVGGSIDAIFNSNWHDPDGPFLEFGDEIKGFGIKHMQFKPKWLEITWNESSKELVVAHKDYQFTLKFHA